MKGFDRAAINPVSGTPGVVRFAGLDGYSTSPDATDWNNFGPRLGFAWRPFKTTVVRGGHLRRAPIRPRRAHVGFAGL